MVTVQRRMRAGPVLTGSKLPCLGKMATVNVTEGCAHGCCYCYARGYSQYPGQGKITLFENLPELVRDELRRKRKKPRRVYFSPSSDAFQPVPEVLDITRATMAVLLERGIEVSFLTKGAIPESFIELFQKYPKKVFARIGMTTLDEKIASAMEPGAATPARRLRCIEDLADIGICASVRLDPLVPDLTDRPDRLDLLLRAIARRGVVQIAASYLFLRPAFARPTLDALKTLAADEASLEPWPWQKMTTGVGGAQMLPVVDRQQRFERLIQHATDVGLEVHVCQCKNPDIALAHDCNIAGSPRSEYDGQTMRLFSEKEF
jgi:DNA repair photolyase